MTYYKNIINLVVILLVISAKPIAAQDITDHSGYVDFSEISSQLGVEADKVINIHGAMLRLVIAAARKDDPELAELLTTVDGIFVRGYRLSGLDVNLVQRQGRTLRAELERSSWEIFLKVNDRDESVQMYVKTNGLDIAGIVLISSDQRSDEMIYLNIVGNIDPEQLSLIGDKFNMGGL